MAKQIIAEKKVGDTTVQRTFNPITWNLLGVDKGGFTEIKQGKKPKELDKPKGEQLGIPTE